MTVIFLPSPPLPLSKPELPTVSCSALPATLPNHFNSCSVRFREKSLQVGAKLFSYVWFRLPGIFYFHASPHSAFCYLFNVLFEFILPALYGVWHLQHPCCSPGSKYRYPISPWKYLSFLRIQTSWLPWVFELSLMASRNNFVDCFFLSLEWEWSFLYSKKTSKVQWVDTTIFKSV